MIELDKFPCQYCNGDVIYTSNGVLYGGRTYGSGMCYYCTGCGASVGTHESKPRQAYGILATKQMQNVRKICHNYFDKSWKTNQISRSSAYKKLALKLNIPKSDCHFGMFDLDMLRKSLKIVEKEDWWKN